MFLKKEYFHFLKLNRSRHFIPSVLKVPQFVYRPTGLGKLRKYGGSIMPAKVITGRFKKHCRLEMIPLNVQRCCGIDVDEFWNKFGELCDRYSPQECLNYFRHAGYSKNKKLQSKF